MVAVVVVEFDEVAELDEADGVGGDSLEEADAAVGVCRVMP